MAINKDLFSSHNFQSTIRLYCIQLGWTLSTITPNMAILEFRMESGSAQIIFISRFDTTLEFSCPSGLKFSSFRAVPHTLSSYLLKENSKYKYGFWCIQEIDNQPIFSIMHNAEISLMDVSLFRQVVKALTTKCDDFEQAAEQAMQAI